MDVSALSLAQNSASRGDAVAAKAAEDFEAMVLQQLLEPLFSSVETPAIAGGGDAENAFKSLLQEQYAKAMAARGGVGIAAHVKDELIAMQARAQSDGVTP